MRSFCGPTGWSPPAPRRPPTGRCGGRRRSRRWRPRGSRRSSAPCRRRSSPRSRCASTSTTCLARARRARARGGARAAARRGHRRAAAAVHDLRGRRRRGADARARARRARRGARPLEGREEWGVKLLLDRDAGRRPRRQRRAPGRRGSWPTWRRRRSQLAAREAGARARRAARRPGRRRAARRGAVDAVRLPAQNRELSRPRGRHGAQRRLPGRATRPSCAPAWRRCRSVTRRYGARIDLTGPWPPYNFVTSAAAAHSPHDHASPSRTSR